MERGEGAGNRELQQGTRARIKYVHMYIAQERRRLWEMSYG